IVVRLPGNLSIDDEGVLAVAAMERMNELSFPNATVTATGAPILLDDINHYLRGGMLMLGGIAVAIMTLILLVLFDVRWRLLPLAVILVGVVWAFGLAGYLGIPLTIVTIAGLPVMLGVGIDYAIQLHARVEEEVILDRSDHPMQETARNLGPALLVVTFDAIFAFLALRFAQVPMLRDFGLLLAVGIAVICLNSIVMPLAALGIREYRSPTTGRDFRQGALGRLTVWLGSLPQVWAIPLAVASVAIFIGGIAVEDDLQLQTDPIEWVDQSSQTVQDIHTIEDEVGTSGELGVFVETDDLYTNENLQWMHDFRIEQFDKFGPQSGAPRQLLTANSIEQVLSDITYLDGFGSIAPTGAEAELGWAVAPADIQASLVVPDGTAGNIVFRVSPGSIEDLAVIVNDVRDNIAPPDGTQATPSGLAVVGVGLLENLEANRVLLTYLAMLFVFLFLAVRLRSVIRALLSLVPVAIAVGAASLVAWIAGFNLRPMTAVGGPLVIATCTEFTSLILLRFVEERARGIEPQEAVDVVAGRTGRAFIVSGLTAIAGVAVLSFSTLPLLRDFGRVVAMNVTVALLSALVVLPPLLVWAERRGWVSRGLIKEPAPFIATPYEHAGPGTDTARAPGS
ncbi:MAG TPA: MMPL family transporter, partial [Desertimonas sp.]|nr:MMPL family transporter [Desertimonas sp.]